MVQEKKNQNSDFPHWSIGYSGVCSSQNSVSFGYLDVDTSLNLNFTSKEKKS
jgi:hypothetical protein